MNSTGLPTRTPSESPIVFYDGSCGLCHRSVRWLLRRDPDARLRFAPLDGATALQLALAPPAGHTPESIIVIDGGQTFYRSRAFFAVLQHVRSGWRWLRVFRWLPAWLTDLPYRLVARVRYRIFGRADACALPDPSERGRFLP